MYDNRSAEVVEKVKRNLIGRGSIMPLLDFADQNGLEDFQLLALSRLTGRGYKPPKTVEGWTTIWDAIGEYYANEPE